MVFMMTVFDKKMSLLFRWQFVTKTLHNEKDKAQLNINQLK